MGKHKKKGSYVFWIILCCTDVGACNVARVLVSDTGAPTFLGWDMREK